MIKKISIIILTIILSLTFISCTKAPDKIDVDNGYSALLADTKWYNEETDHTIFFGKPEVGATSRYGSFADNDYMGQYMIYTGKYANDFSKKFEDCSQNLKDKFWNIIDHKLTSNVFGLIINLNNNENIRFEYIACIDEDKLILCDYKQVYVYTKTNNNYDIILDTLDVDEEIANNIISRINLMLTLDYYDITSIDKNPDLGYIFTVNVMSTNDTYYVYTSDEYDILIITKNDLYENNGEVIFRQKE